MTLWHDVLYATRRLAAKPGFTLTALATLTLGVGFNAAIFTFVNAFLIRPLPIAQPERVVSLSFGRAGNFTNISFPNYRDLRDRNQVFTAIAATRPMPMALSREGDSARIWGYLVTGNYFDLLGIAPWRGRFFTSEDDGASPSPVAVLSYAAWQKLFGGDDGAIGRTMKINGQGFTIIGVAPPGFIGMERFYASEIWVPFSVIRIIEGRDWRDQRNTHNAWAVARLKPGISRRQAEASLAIVASQMAREHPDVNEGFAIHLATPGLLGNTLRAPVIGFSVVLIAVALLTLLVACTNLSGLILARAADRRKEMAIRVALGAGRGTIVRLMLIESLILGAGGAALGLLAAVWLNDALQAWLPATQIPLERFGEDWRVIAFGIIAAMATAAFSGLLPASRAARVDVAPALKNEAASGSLRGLHLRDVYLAIQVAVCMVLLVGAVTMVRTLRETLRMNFGFNPDHAVALRVDLATVGYTAQEGHEFQRRLMERMSAIPGVEAAGLSNSIPFSTDQSNTTVMIEGRPVPKPSERVTAVFYSSGPGYFRAIGTRILAGRDFDARDRDGAPQVLIVNQTFADKLLPGEDPIGKGVQFGAGGGPIYRIVGVVEPGRYTTVTEDPSPAVWRPAEQAYNSATTVTLRSHLGDREALAAARTVVAQLNPDLAVYDAMPLREFMDLPLAPLRLSTGAITLMGALAALLCALGLYGLLAYGAVQRTREFGIRMALGARAANVLGLLLRRGVMLVAASGAIGIVVSFFATRIIAQFLYAKTDVSIYLSALALLAGISLVACLVPARRVLRIQPSDALRHE